MRLLRWGLKRLPLRGCITRVETAEPLIALTFDDGPDPRFTPRLLDLLERHHAHGTFFMLGSAAADHPDLVRRVGEAGHAIGNHTWDHPAVSRTSWKETRSQIIACRKALEPYGDRLFRPPYLAQSKVSVLNCRLHGYEVIMASLDSGDWWNPDGDEIAETLLGAAAPGEIVLLHDGLAGFSGRRLPHPPLPDRNAMLHGLDRFLTEVGGRFRFVTVPALVEAGQAVREKRYSRGPAPAGPS
jgi:peptidoglycan-N-acetylglucosamine deacetylase